jgi:hypothetical protein
MRYGGTMVGQALCTWRERPCGILYHPQPLGLLRAPGLGFSLTRHAQSSSPSLSSSAVQYSAHCSVQDQSKIGCTTSPGQYALERL